LKLLLRQRANYCAVSLRGETILYFAAGKGDYKTIEILREAALKDLDAFLKNKKDQTAVDVIKS
jgi:hypothetical protein